MTIRVRVSISIYFAVFLACVLVLDRTGYANIGLLCVLIHECGHILVLYRMKVPLEKIELRLFGIRITPANCVLSYAQELILSVAGCTANLLACLPAVILYENGVLCHFTGAFLMLNLLLALFNLLPIASLDGGSALEALLCLRLEAAKASNIVTLLSFLLIVPLGAFGIYIVIKTGYNLSLLTAAAYLGAALIIKSGKKRVFR